jgi:hypothetical protein
VGRKLIAGGKWTRLREGDGVVDLGAPYQPTYSSVACASPDIQPGDRASFYAQTPLSFTRGYKRYSFHSESFAEKNPV